MEANAGRTGLAEASDPGGRVQILSTEHWSLLSTRSLAYTKSFSRVQIFVSLLTGAVVALALLAQVGGYRQAFTIAAILLLSVVLFVGLATIARLVALNREDMRCVLGMSRLRHAYLEAQPELEPYFVTGAQDDLRGLLLTMDMDMVPGQLRAGDAAHALETLPAMLGVIAGVLAALVAGSLGAPTPVAVAVASAVFLATAVLLAAFIYRDFDTFAARLPVRFPSEGGHLGPREGGHHGGLRARHRFPGGRARRRRRQGSQPE
jgi:hypothetical protein